MSKLMDKIRRLAAEQYKHIVLPEGEDDRVIEATKVIVDNKIAQLTLLGNKDVITSKLGSYADKVNIIDPQNSDKVDELANVFYELRKAKGMTPELAKATILKDSLFFGTLLVKTGICDGMVGGCVRSTADTIRPGLQIIKTKPGVKTVSSLMFMAMPEDGPGYKYGEDGVLVFSDCAVNINPTSEQLVDIAFASYENAKKIIDMKNPKVAFLSFSTKGSAKHELVDKVVEAANLMKEAHPEVESDGELQLDAAIVSKVAQLKAPGSKVAGNANVLIFPDLQAANIGYKLVQRFAGAEAVGPICQGFAKPINDLSRGCNADDIVSVVAITALQA